MLIFSLFVEAAMGITFDESVQIAVNHSLLWGTYRSNLYFGTRTRSPSSLLNGLMWFAPIDYSSFNSIRHDCNTGDGIRGYDWNYHDGNKIALQNLLDMPLNLDLKTHWLKFPGGNNGGDWVLKVKGNTIQQENQNIYSSMFYFASEDGTFDVKKSKNGIIQITGSSSELGDYTINVIREKSLNQYPEMGILATTLPASDLWKSKQIVQQIFSQAVHDNIELIQNPKDGKEPPPPYAFMAFPVDKDYENVNFVVCQMFSGVDFEFHVAFTSHSAHPGKSGAEIQKIVNNRINNEFENTLRKETKSFDEKFERVFKLQERGYDESTVEFARVAMSNLIGGTSYFYGNSIVDSLIEEEEEEETIVDTTNKSFEDIELEELIMEDDDSNEDNEELSEMEKPIELKQGNPEFVEERELFTSIPSRPFFPRGFLWDEGFHQALIVHWNPLLTYETLKSWMALMDEDGWIAREQILGEEARSKVPEKFQVQYPQYANPPTLIIALVALIESIKSSISDSTNYNKVNPSATEFAQGTEEFYIQQIFSDFESAKAEVRILYDGFKKNFNWYRKTQKGSIFLNGKWTTEEDVFRWRGRSPGHCLTSGLDDYPRSEPPARSDLHLDLTSWMAFYADTLAQVADFLEETKEKENFLNIKKSIVNNLNQYFWSKENDAFGDVYSNIEGKRSVLVHKGYITLFPFLFGLLDSSKSHRLKSTLDMLSDPQELWSDYGIRSLSLSDEYHGKGENYWRGAIWINMNYLVIRSLSKFYRKDHPYVKQTDELYKNLRTNLIENIYKEYEETGFLWEQYNSETGKGQRTHPFNGWTSLVVNLMAELY